MTCLAGPHFDFDHAMLLFVVFRFTDFQICGFQDFQKSCKLGLGRVRPGLGLAGAGLGPAGRGRVGTSELYPSPNDSRSDQIYRKMPRAFAATSLVQLLDGPMTILKSTQRTPRFLRWSRTASTIRTHTQATAPTPWISAQDILPKARGVHAAQCGSMEYQQNVATFQQTLGYFGPDSTFSDGGIPNGSKFHIGVPNPFA